MALFNFSIKKIISQKRILKELKKQDLVEKQMNMFNRKHVQFFTMLYRVSEFYFDNWKRNIWSVRFYIFLN